MLCFDFFSYCTEYYMKNIDLLLANHSPFIHSKFKLVILAWEILINVLRSRINFENALRAGLTYVVSSIWCPIQIPTTWYIPYFFFKIVKYLFRKNHHLSFSHPVDFRSIKSSPQAACTCLLINTQKQIDSSCLVTIISDVTTFRLWCIFTHVRAYLGIIPDYTDEPFNPKPELKIKNRNK